MSLGSQQIELDGLRIAYRRAGEGPPLVLLHGGPTDSREFRRQLESLSDMFTVVAWDMPGCGQSAIRPSTSESATTWAASPRSSRRSAWSARTCSGCRSAAAWHSSCTGLILTCRGADAVGLRRQGQALTLSVAEDLHARIPGSQLVVLSGAGHMVYMEAPDRFNAEVRRFLRSVQT